MASTAAIKANFPSSDFAITSPTLSRTSGTYVAVARTPSRDSHDDFHWL